MENLPWTSFFIHTYITKNSQIVNKKQSEGCVKTDRYYITMTTILEQR